MFITCNRIPVHPQYAEAFEASFRDRAGQVDSMPGFVSFQLLKPAEDGEPYIVMTTWMSRAHFTAWTESPEFQQGHARSGSLPREAYLGRPTLETYEVIQAT